VASAYELHPGVDLAGLAALKHGNIAYGASAGSNRLHTMDLMGGFTSVVMTLGGQLFDHARGDLDSPYCDDHASCDDGDPCTSDSCSPGGCVHTETAGCCEADLECADGNTCTQDSCEANQCVNLPISLEDGNVCTLDQCDPESGLFHLPITGCCLFDSACNDFNDCTRDTCEANLCTNRRIQSCGPPPGGTVKRRDQEQGG